MRRTSPRGGRQHHPRPWRRANGRGQSMVEFAFVIPVFLLLLFGTLEIGLLLKTRAAYDQAAQQAVRVAASAGNAGDADAQMLTALQQTLPAENLSAIASVTVFDATIAGTPANTTAQTVYTYSGGHFVCQGAPTASPSIPCPVPGAGATYTYWDPLLRDTKVGELDHIGLRISYKYRGATGIIPTLPMTDTTTTVIEPNSYQP